MVETSLCSSLSLFCSLFCIIFTRTASRHTAISVWRTNDVKLNSSWREFDGWRSDIVGDGHPTDANMLIINIISSSLMFGMKTQKHLESWIGLRHNTFVVYVMKDEPTEQIVMAEISPIWVISFWWSKYHFPLVLFENGVYGGSIQRLNSALYFYL